MGSKRPQPPPETPRHPTATSPPPPPNPDVTAAMVLARARTAATRPAVQRCDECDGIHRTHQCADGVHRCVRCAVTWAERENRADARVRMLVTFAGGISTGILLHILATAIRHAIQ